MDRKEILKLVKKYAENNLKPKKFDPAKDFVRYAGRVFDHEEVLNLINASLDFWLTEGRFSEEFAEKISDFLDVDNVYLTNSGSSSNLLALSALTSDKLGDRRLKPGDEVITVAAGFPATVTPILQNNCIPVFVDVELPTYNINVENLKKAVSSKTKAIFLAHTLGNPWNVSAVKEIAEKNNLWLIEDNCDAFGSKYDGKYTGTFGDISTISFYPAHHITTGEGGAVVTNNEQLGQLIRAFRDWGRDCYCNSGENNTCGKRFTQQFGTLPKGYDHKYVYSEIGYNLKMTDMQAAIGAAQMDKLESFCEKRKKNFARYQEMLKKYDNYLILPKATENSDPAWFTYILSIREDAPFSRNDIVTHLTDRRIETRNIFAGNMVRQPAFIGKPHRMVDELSITDFVMNNTFFLGTYPGMTTEMLDYTEEVFSDFMKRY
ncbi:MAG: lipopolysaccharide biosynthesis protein RfbH [Bacteriovoracaceae bacterium]|nr:lipopolysaccharide biosynthesis protein RfbH [Bacteriovoracaceae bacterium]